MKVKNKDYVIKQIEDCIIFINKQIGNKDKNTKIKKKELQKAS